MLLPLFGLEFGGDVLSGVVGIVVLSFVALMDLVIGRYLMLPSLRRKGQPRSSVESVGYSLVDSTGVVAIIAGVGTGWPWAAFVPGIIGLYSWMSVRQYFEEWVEAPVTS